MSFFLCSPTYVKINHVWGLLKPSVVWDGPLPVHKNGTFFANASSAAIHCPQDPVIDLGTGSIMKSNAEPIDLITSYYSRAGVERRQGTLRQPIWGQEDCLVASVSTPSVCSRQLNRDLMAVEEN